MIGLHILRNCKLKNIVLLCYVDSLVKEASEDQVHPNRHQAHRLPAHRQPAHRPQEHHLGWNMLTHNNDIQICQFDKLKLERHSIPVKPFFYTQKSKFDLSIFMLIKNFITMITVEKQQAIFEITTCNDELAKWLGKYGKSLERK